MWVEASEVGVWVVGVGERRVRVRLSGCGRRVRWVCGWWEWMRGE